MKKKTKSTFRFPFDIDARIFLGLAFLFFVLSISQVSNFLFPKMRMDKLKVQLENNIDANLYNFEEDESIKSLIAKSVTKKLTSKETSVLASLPYGIQVFKDGNLLFWNSQKFPILNDTFLKNVPTPYQDINGYFVIVKRELALEGLDILLILPIKYENTFNNEYLRNHFVVGDQENDYGIHVTMSRMDKTDLSLKVLGKDVFYINRKDDFLNINDSEGHRLFWNALSFIFFGIAIHTYFKVTTKRRVALKRFLYMLILALFVRALNYFFAFPEDFSSYALFRPEFYASDSINCSLGDTLINMCLFFWILLFYIINVQGLFNEYQFLAKKVIYGIGLFVLLFFGQVYFLLVIRSLIQDSIINFDFTQFSELTLFSFLGLLTICIAFGNFIILSYIGCNYYEKAFKGKYLKYILLVMCLTLFLIINSNDSISMYAFVVCSFLLLFLTYDYLFSKIKFDFNSYFLLLLIILVALLNSIFLNWFVQNKEKENRIAMGASLLDKNSIVPESKLGEVERELLLDSTFIASCFEDDRLTSLNLSRQIYQKYVSKSLSNYVFQCQLFSLDGKLIHSLSDSIGDHRQSRIKVINDNAKPLFINNKDLQINQFFSETKSRKVLGLYFGDELKSIIILAVSDYFNSYLKDISILKKGNSSLIYPFQSSYSFGLYSEGILFNSFGNYVFPYNEKDSPKDTSIFTIDANRDILWMSNKASNSSVAIAKYSNNLYLITTLFAYVFFIYFTIITLYIIANVIARSNLNYNRFINLLSLNLRLRLHFAILLVVFVSFIIVGYFTYSIIVSRIQNKAQDELKITSQTIQKDLNERIKSLRFLKTNFQIENEETLFRLLAFFDQINAQFSKDLNIYDYESGELVYSSQKDLFQAGLLSSQIDYKVLQQIKMNGIDNIQQNEHIGKYNYSAIYSCLRNSNGKTFALMQIPSLNSNMESQNEKNSILITLINIYVFVFLLSSVLALFISNSVTRPFRIVVKQFTQINLAKTNEPLKWNSSDEIGMLVKEYNRTLRKLENSTVQLAKSERELAWREMAKQVAHEIKNPLTPMKLSVQMLQRAIRNNIPSVIEITERVCATLVEQIDVLTEIATNFSSFAKMPDNKKECVLLNEILYNVTGMYNDDHENEFLFLIPEYPIYVTVDKGQLIRVFTNIIQNAIQSIPIGRKGNISLIVSKINFNFVRISIRDNGEGISLEKGKKLFEPYFTTKTSGTGLGLAMCKDIIEGFGGAISFESILNTGTTFHVDLLMDVQDS